MKKFCPWLCAVLLLTSFTPAFSQPIPSSCLVPWILQQEYDVDVKSLAVKYMAATSSPDTLYVTIPQAQQDTIMEGMAAIFNSGHPAGDSIFDMYCVHDMAYKPVTTGYIIGVNINEPWTQNWANLQTMTGLPVLDTLLVKYDLQITNWFQFIGAAVFTTTKLMNPYALEDSLKWASSAILYVDPDMLIGAAGAIQYDVVGGIRKYQFSFQWNDCFDGCDNYHTWLFDVHPDCSVDYLGYLEGGVFGIEPLPTPVNCNISTGLEKPRDTEADLNVYPNPAGDILFVALDEKISNAPLLKVIDVTGKQHPVGVDIDEGLMTLAIGNLPSGYYIVMVENAGRYCVGKFIK